VSSICFVGQPNDSEPKLANEDDQMSEIRSCNPYVDRAGPNEKENVRVVDMIRQKFVVASGRKLVKGDKQVSEPRPLLQRITTALDGEMDTIHRSMVVGCVNDVEVKCADRNKWMSDSPPQLRLTTHTMAW
jgi:hypothetical protein